MIASFSNNFIFLKTRKTGGTSVEIVLSSWCSAPSDVCTRITPDDEITRREFGGLKPKGQYAGARINNHMPAVRVREIFPELWDRAFKFTIERHPYEKVVSRVYWNIGRRGGDPVADFNAELDATLDSGRFIDRDIYLIDGKIAVDEVIDYSRMWDRVAQLGEGWGKTMPEELPRAKGQHRKDRRAAADILTSEQKIRIYEAAAFEFETFGFVR